VKVEEGEGPSHGQPPTSPPLPQRPHLLHEPCKIYQLDNSRLI
jgi:hypothetical protein